jgi:hypothetical protein
MYSLVMTENQFIIDNDNVLCYLNKKSNSGYSNVSILRAAYKYNLRCDRYKSVKKLV